jgi:uncharacterized protein
MQYSEGQLGRVFVVRIDDGEDFIVAIQKFIQDTKIQAGSILFLGALRNARMVTGPEEMVIPPDPHFVMFEGGWETFGIGTIYPGDKGPMVHYHTSVGRAGHALTGCLRDVATTYIMIEAVVLEINGLNIRRTFDPKMQVHLPTIQKEEPVPKKEVAKEPEPVVQKPAADKSPENPDETGGLADIIRDLTRRSPK